MQKGIIEYPCGQGQSEAILVRTLSELNEYLDIINHRASVLVLELMKSNFPVDRWDHMLPKTIEGGAMAAALIDCKTEGGIPILRYTHHLDGVVRGMLKTLSLGKTIAINPVGGYFPLQSDDMIVREWEDSDIRPKSYKIVSGARYINLENDPTLEDHTKEYLASLGESEFSYVCRLGQYNDDELYSIFKEFVEAGGEIVYVYTTGMKSDQMYDYFDQAVFAGVNQFIFEFNAGITPEIQDFKDFTLTSSAEVTFLDEGEDSI